MRFSVGIGTDWLKMPKNFDHVQSIFARIQDAMIALRHKHHDKNVQHGVILHK